MCVLPPFHTPMLRLSKTLFCYFFPQPNQFFFDFSPPLALPHWLLIGFISLCLCDTSLEVSLADWAVLSPYTHSIPFSLTAKLFPATSWIFSPFLAGSAPELNGGFKCNLLSWPRERHLPVSMAKDCSLHLHQSFTEMNVYGCAVCACALRDGRLG